MVSSKKVIVACMRNEALFVVEWVAHHLAIGFDRIIVYTNDCDDGTNTILQAMSQNAPVEHYDNPGPYDAGTIQKQALAMALKLPQVKKADWVLHIDADEYVNITEGNRTIDDLIALHPSADAIAIMWRHFGSSGLNTWDGGSVIETFTRCEDIVPDVTNGEISGFKTLFRPQKFKRIGIHTPKLPYDNFTPVVVNTAGVAMPLGPILTRTGSGYPAGPEHLTWENALLHHHHVKSNDLHAMKHARGDANGRRNGKRKIGSEFYRYADRNDVVCNDLVELRPRVRDWEERLRSMPGVVEAEDGAWVWFRARFRPAVLDTNV